jgi:hypothetical protein
MHIYNHDPSIVWIILNVPKVFWHFNKRRQLSHAFIICNWASLLQEMKDCHKQPKKSLIFNLQSNIYLVNYKTSYMHCNKLLYVFCLLAIYIHVVISYFDTHSFVELDPCTMEPKTLMHQENLKVELCKNKRDGSMHNVTRNFKCNKITSISSFAKTKQMGPHTM